MSDSDLKVSLCKIIEDYGFFPVFENGGIIWNIAIFPQTGKRENLCKIMKELKIPVVFDSKKGPRIKQVKECFVFDKSKFPEITAMIEKAVQTR